MSDLDKAVESGELKRIINGMDIAGIHPSLKLLCSAARRFLALTETGPDYEAARRKLEHRMSLPGGVTSEGDIKPIVDAALADYLTEEETK